MTAPHTTFTTHPNTSGEFEEIEFHHDPSARLSLAPYRRTRKVVLIGNPGVGKSTILNALGGRFPSGFSKVSGLTKEVLTQVVACDTAKGQIPLQLIDVPGIDDCLTGDGEDPIFKYLQMLQATLNSGGDFVIFFVLKPDSGRVSPSDFLIMKTVLDSLKKVPEVGMILTCVDHDEVEDYQSPGYVEALAQTLRNIVKNKDKTFLVLKPLVLANHKPLKGFNDEEKDAIFNHLLSFNPKPCESVNMVGQVVRNYFDMARSFF
ncbi:hypothetical protein EC991_001771 [Linnemannia zychae]|nr:hypothetical protein EC991_001771 [Linnemannia zychae]